MKSILLSKWTKRILFLACLVPFAILLWRILHSDLGPNPVQFVEYTTGRWTLRFLAITLAIAPARRILRLPELIRFRRMTGLFAFFYVCMHFLSYLGIDKYFMWDQIWSDIHKRPYIIAGFTGFVLLIPLALTSTAWSIRWLGGKRWRMLHRLIYLTAVAGVIHYYWQVKSDKRAPLFYAAIFGALLAWRVGEWFFKRARKSLAAEARAPRTSATN
ncbi:MAG TPA: protein-methionine-sulfoxide reductase heme-binding subunit MsrQ [Patescibacteria group bacterium]|nr:protein-methionine-sulfoxide reductase heme-binding subunit MsrQ [Patescibacteria group bacterium]